MDVSIFNRVSHKRQFKLTITLPICVNFIRLIGQTFHLRKASHERNTCSSNQKQIGQGIHWRYRCFQRHHHFAGFHCDDRQPQRLNGFISAVKPLRVKKPCDLSQGFVFLKVQLGLNADRFQRGISQASQAPCLWRVYDGV